jgi:hypothetical protein
LILNTDASSILRLETRFILVMFLVVLLLALSGCDQALVPVSIADPTLVPTLVLPIEESQPPLPTASATLWLTPEETAGTLTPTRNETPTRTITPWSNDTPTVGPSLSPTRTSTITRVPTQTRTPSRTPTITSTPTITYTPTPPPPVHNITRPGLMSKVLSPINIEMYAVTGEGGKITIELVGEDARIISRQVISRGTETGRRVWLAQQLPFEIQAAAETARLQVSSYDEFGRLVARSSVDLILLSVGRNEINPQAVLQSPYLIRRPVVDQVISGGTLVIEALARPVNDSPLLIELINEYGTVMLIKQVIVEPPTDEQSHTPFTVEIRYSVRGPTPVRLLMYQEGSRIPGSLFLISRKFILEP